MSPFKTRSSRVLLLLPSQSAAFRKLQLKLPAYLLGARGAVGQSRGSTRALTVHTDTLQLHAQRLDVASVNTWQL